ncbi:hypothetical protein H4219_004152 [Mycoemilia scoparia]|uniref:Uncharacterized protein n=1 Tax=Mycoemilia scoparia TaxID=417184 RepID=A0A9W7ZT30_9FUNG|nr:hypothetical protein H4219_004152 [Mycoemilia scoparia]
MKFTANATIALVATVAAATVVAQTPGSAQPPQGAAPSNNGPALPQLSAGADKAAVEAWQKQVAEILKGAAPAGGQQPPVPAAATPSANQIHHRRDDVPSQESPSATPSAAPSNNGLKLPQLSAGADKDAVEAWQKQVAEALKAGAPTAAGQPIHRRDEGGEDEGPQEN